MNRTRDRLACRWWWSRGRSRGVFEGFVRVRHREHVAMSSMRPRLDRKARTGMDPREGCTVSANWMVKCCEVRDVNRVPLGPSRFGSDSPVPPRKAQWFPQQEQVSGGRVVVRVRGLPCQKGTFWGSSRICKGVTPRPRCRNRNSQSIRLCQNRNFLIRLAIRIKSVFHPLLEPRRFIKRPWYAFPAWSAWSAWTACPAWSAWHAWHAWHQNRPTVLEWFTSPQFLEIPHIPTFDHRTEFVW